MSREEAQGERDGVTRPASAFADTTASRALGDLTSVPPAGVPAESTVRT
ncbi:hypothetical protein AB0903_28425 [Streptomyces sp. NPDC048389]